MTWDEFCPEMSLEPLLVSYKDLVNILNTYMRQYHTGTLAPRGCQVRSRTVEDYVRLIVQGLAAMGAPEPRLTI